MAEGPEQRARRRVGTMVRDKYRIDAFIATGSMANVYAATHRNGSRVALKILHEDLARNASMAERFRREGYFANAIGHPGVVRAIDDDVAEDGCVFIVMELLTGENLEERRQRLGGKVPLPEVLQIADAMLDVLSAAHDHEVLHRDLKPENVFITRKNEVKLLDFGVARFNDGRSSSDMTATGMVLGTPAFMPPEQALGRREDVDARSDIWGVGATLFTVITGESVHVGGDAKTKLIATARTPARPIRDVAPHVPRAVASVIDRALAFDKAKRWADANAMREALRWARMSLDDDVASRLERPDDVEPPPVPTRRTTATEQHDEPTLAGRPLASTHARKRDVSFDDSTAKRPPMRPYPTADEVFTSAPPATEREPPPSMAMSEDPTFSLRNASPRRAQPEPVPATERMPQHLIVPPRTVGVEQETAERLPAPAPHIVDTAALFRTALANTGFVADESSSARTLPRFDARATEADARSASSRPASASAPAGSARPVAGHPHRAHPPAPTAFSLARTAPGIGTSAPEILVPDAAPAPHAFPSAPPAHALTSSSVPPKYPSTVPFAQSSAGSVARTPRPPGGRPSLAPEQPGPLLSTIVPKKPRSGSLLRALVPIFVGILAGVVTYVVVARQRAASASHASTTTPSTSASAVVSPSALPAGAVAPEPSSTPAASAASAVPAASAAPAVSSAPNTTTNTRKTRKPRPKPTSAPATPATSTASTEAPAPTPVDALPARDPE